MPSLAQLPYEARGFSYRKQPFDSQAISNDARNREISIRAIGLDEGFAPRAAFLIALTRLDQSGCTRKNFGFAWQALSSGLLNRIDSLRMLRPGWDDEAAPPIKHDAIANARRAIEHLASSYLSFREPDVVPKFDGYLQIEWHSESRTLELEASSKGWQVLGVMRQPAGDAYFNGEMNVDDFKQVDELYCWWAENRLIWPFP